MKRPTKPPRDPERKQIKEKIDCDDYSVADILRRLPKDQDVEKAYVESDLYYDYGEAYPRVYLRYVREETDLEYERRRKKEEAAYKKYRKELTIYNAWKKKNKEKLEQFKKLKAELGNV